MKETTNLTVNIDKKLRQETKELFAEMGMTTSTAVTLFLKQCVREQKIPFSITVCPDSKN